MRKIALIVALLGAVTLFTVHSSSTVHAAALQKPASSPAHQTTKMVTVHSGDTLAKIAAATKVTWRRIFDANTNINNPNLIYPGQKLRIPSTDEKLAHRALPGEAVTAAPVAQKPAATPSVHPPQTVIAAPAADVSSGSVWDRLANCESSGNWSINTGNGFYGGLQFTLSSWQAVGGTGYPSQASKSEQIARAEKLLAAQGWGAWPACSAKLGLR